MSQKQHILYSNVDVMAPSTKQVKVRLQLGMSVQDMLSMESRRSRVVSNLLKIGRK